MEASSVDILWAAVAKKAGAHEARQREREARGRARLRQPVVRQGAREAAPVEQGVAAAVDMRRPAR